jgi:hypothetical protein
MSLRDRPSNTLFLPERHGFFGPASSCCIRIRLHHPARRSPCFAYPEGQKRHIEYIYKIWYYINMTYSAPDTNEARSTNLFPAGKSAADRITAGAGPVLNGSARGKMLQLVGQVRPEKKDDKEAEKKDDKAAGKKAA